MLKYLQGFFLSLASLAALAVEEAPRTTSTSWEIYLVVLAVVVGGFAWVFIQSKRQRERDARKGQPKA